MSSSDRAAGATPTALAAGSVPFVRSPTAWTATSTARAAKLRAMAFVARASASCMPPPRRSWWSRQARIRAADTSTPESMPKPTRITEPAATPAATATTPSTVFHPMVATFRSRLRPTACARASRDTGTVATIRWSSRACSGADVEILVGVVDDEIETGQVVEGVGQAG